MFIRRRGSPRQNLCSCFKCSKLEDDNPISCGNDVALESAGSYDFVFGSNDWAKDEAMEDLLKTAKTFAEVTKKEVIVDLSSSSATSKTTDFVSETTEKLKEFVIEVFEKIDLVDPDLVVLVPVLNYFVFSKILTPSDAYNDGGFSFLRLCADSIFPTLDSVSLPCVISIQKLSACNSQNLLPTSSDHIFQFVNHHSVKNFSLEEKRDGFSNRILFSLVAERCQSFSSMVVRALLSGQTLALVLRNDRRSVGSGVAATAATHSCGSHVLTLPDLGYGYGALLHVCDGGGEPPRGSIGWAIDTHPVHSWNIMTADYAKLGCFEQALKLFDEMCVSEIVMLSGALSIFLVVPFVWHTEIVKMGSLCYAVFGGFTAVVAAPKFSKNNEDPFHSKLLKGCHSDLLVVSGSRFLSKMILPERKLVFTA